MTQMWMWRSWSILIITSSGNCACFVWKFWKKAASYQLSLWLFRQSVFSIFLILPLIWGLVEDGETETWLGRWSNRLCIRFPVRGCRCAWRNATYLEAIAQLHRKPSQMKWKHRKWATDTFQRPWRILIVCFTYYSKEGQVIGVCTLMYLENTITFMDLRLEVYRGARLQEAINKISHSAKVIEQNDKISSCSGRWQYRCPKCLYEKIGFIKQTQVVYLKPKSKTERNEAC